MGQRQVVDSETGEVLYELEEGDTIFKKKQKEFLNTNMQLRTGNFVSVNIEEYNALAKVLTDSEQLVLSRMLTYVSYTSNCLKYSNGNPINLKAMQKITCLSENTVVRAVNGLIEKDVLFKGKNSKNNLYFMNPWIVNKGSIVNKVLKEMFQHYKIQTLGGVAWGSLKDGEDTYGRKSRRI